MTNESWLQGLALLVANLRDRDLTPEAQAIRGATYRQELGHLSDAEWEATVRGCVRTLDWFPSIRELLEHAAAHRRESDAAKAIERRSEETREEGRAAARQGLALVRAAVAEAEKLLPPAPAHVLAEPEPVVVLQDERYDELQRQKAAILEAAERGGGGV